MKLLSFGLTSALALSSLSLASCAGFTPAVGPTGGTSFTEAMKAIASDPRCGHTDRIQGNLGGLGGNNLSVFLERTCPPAVGAIAAPAVSSDPPS